MQVGKGCSVFGSRGGIHRADQQTNLGANIGDLSIVGVVEPTALLFLPFQAATRAR